MTYIHDSQPVTQWCGCGLDVQLPEEGIWYRPAADSEPGSDGDRVGRRRTGPDDRAGHRIVFVP
jgi:hypothetical protein